MLGIIEVKLLQMEQLAKQAKEENLSTVEIEILNSRINNLATQVNAIDEQSRNIEDREIIE
jgi:cell division protein FtsB